MGNQLWALQNSEKILKIRTLQKKVFPRSEKKTQSLLSSKADIAGALFKFKETFKKFCLTFSQKLRFIKIQQLTGNYTMAVLKNWLRHFTEVGLRLAI